jgi:peptidoglycan-associated lipoprotein
VQVEGHCDERGTNEYNMALGAKRAHAGAEYLKTLGISAGRVSTMSYGENVPLDPAHNEAAWAKNRRALFKVSGK